MLSHTITSNHNGFLITMELEGQFPPDQEDFMAYLIEMAKHAYNMYYTDGQDAFLDAVEDAVRLRDEENAKPDEWEAGYQAGLETAQDMDRRAEIRLTPAEVSQVDTALEEDDKVIEALVAARRDVENRTDFDPHAETELDLGPEND